MEAHELFAADRPVYLARAPGRLDVMGGIADYSGSLVLELPIAAAAFAAAQAAQDGKVVAVSGDRRVEVPAREVADLPLAGLAERLAGWAAYVVGPAALLAREEVVPLAGLRILVSSDVPEGKGVSSSAAVEVASLQAAAAALGRTLDPRRLALLAQRAENHLAGAPCGVMDQLTAACGERDRLLAVLCRPAEVVGSIAVPPPLTVWGIDSGVRHDVGGEDYRRVRCATFMGKAMVAPEAAYLTELEPSQVDVERLPERLGGDEFLRRHGPIADEVSEVDSRTTYPVRAATVHAIEEHFRVRMFAELIASAHGEARARLLGELMFRSHASYSRCGLGTPETDAVVAAVRSAGWKRGLAGAKVSGGGSGGTVVVLGREDAEPLVRALAGDLGADLVTGSSDGAERFGVRALRQRAT